MPGEQSCAHGWDLYKNTCYMHSAKGVKKSWKEADAYCRASNAQLVHLNSFDSPSFLKGLTKHLATNTNESRFWIAPTRGTHGNFRHNNKPGGNARSCSVFKSHKTGTADCTRGLPFICQRGMVLIGCVQFFWKYTGYSYYGSDK